MQELAVHFGYSVRHTARLLKESTGQNFGEIIRDLKLRKAAALCFPLLLKQTQTLCSK